ncbi:precorrin-6Y C5,15-methyltransferase (decarboxylating) subunit CbiT [Candidatus Bipolaricaulota bacterium]|nr:precorrin-6Y C5,15-methyltransferase (decarboxylating) subunit CbiT [Candidatus Bipolaricaulota bacterium]
MSKWKYKTPGIPDDQFVRGDVPMSKEEVRAVMISKMRLKEDSVVYDIGSGTGSVAVEAALVAEQGSVYAVEKSKEGIELIEENVATFGLDNVEVIHGEGSSEVRGLKPADRAFIGGSGGRLEKIIEAVDKKLRPDGRIVLPAITIETLGIAKEKLVEMGYDPEVISLTVTRTRKAGEKTMFDSTRPVFVISGERGG